MADLILLLSHEYLSSSGLLISLEHPLDVFSQTDARIELYVDGLWLLSEVIRDLDGIVMLVHFFPARSQHLCGLLQSFCFLIFLLLADQPLLALGQTFRCVAHVP